MASFVASVMCDTTPIEALQLACTGDGRYQMSMSNTTANTSIHANTAQLIVMAAKRRFTLAISSCDCR